MSAQKVCKSALDWIIETFNESIKNSNETNPFVIGIGSGSTIVPFIELLAEFIGTLAIKPNIICIPTSEQARHLILSKLKRNPNIFKLGTLDEYQSISVTIDGADAVYFSKKFLIKGGGAAHCQEKIVAEASENYIIVVADHSKIEKTTENVSVPVEVLPIAVNSSKKLFSAHFGDELLSCQMRECPSGSGKIGPIVTDNGNLILDLKFSEKSYERPGELDNRICQYAGIIETGIFWRLPSRTLVISVEAGGDNITSKFL